MSFGPVLYASQLSLVKIQSIEKLNILSQLVPFHTLHTSCYQTSPWPLSHAALAWAVLLLGSC